VNLILFQTIKQTLKVARRLSEETKPAAVYSSGLTRAAETAQLIAGACGVPDSDVSTLTLEQINLNFTISICYFFFLSLRGSVRVLYVVRMNGGFYSFQLVIDQALTERHMGLFQGWSIVDAIKSEEYYTASFAYPCEPVKWLFSMLVAAYSPALAISFFRVAGRGLHQLSERCVPCLNAIAERHKGCATNNSPHNFLYSLSKPAHGACITLAAMYI
jgi:probable phosphoglycerate mutase